MAVTSFHKSTGKWLTSLGSDAKAGDVHLLSSGSHAYSLPTCSFGFPSCQFTRYVLPEPVAFDDRFGRQEPLFDLEGVGTCPLDGSVQNKAVRDAAEAREREALRNRMCRA